MRLKRFKSVGVEERILITIKCVEYVYACTRMHTFKETWVLGDYMSIPNIYSTSFLLDRKRLYF